METFLKGNKNTKDWKKGKYKKINKTNKTLFFKSLAGMSPIKVIYY